MGTTIRPEISENNLYWINKHRYYELKHFCLQYPLWRKAYNSLEGFVKINGSMEHLLTNEHSDPTQRTAISRLWYREHMDIIEQAARDTDPIIGDYILRGVVDGVSYEAINARNRIPCGKDTYYGMYRRFFWLLSKARN